MDRLERIGAAIGRIPAPIFLARLDDRRSRLDVYTTDRKAARRLARQAEAALAEEGAGIRCRAVVRPMSRIGRCRSLEQLVGGLGRDAIVYDPTHVVRRSTAVVALAGRVRAVLGDRVRSVFFEPNRRQLFVIVDRAAHPRAAMDAHAARQRTVKSLAALLADWQKHAEAGFDLAIRVGYQAPQGAELVSVDRATSRLVLADLVRSRRGVTAIRAAAAALLGVGFAVPAGAADVHVAAPPAMAPPAAASEPAVAAPNLTAIIFGSAYELNSHGYGDLWGGGLKGTMPLGHAFGAQVDVAAGQNSYWGAGGHLFWRNPAVGLLGAVASYNTLKGIGMYRYGAEGQLYVNSLTFDARGGYQNGDVPSGFWGEANVTFYAAPNLSLTLGAAMDPNRPFLRGAFEWQPVAFGMGGMSVFADGRIGTGNNWQATAGLAFHFGPAKTLIDRDRRDDPINLTLVYPSKY